MLSFLCETNQDNTVNGTGNYQQNWLQHVNRMENNRLPELEVYQPEGKRNTGRPRRRRRHHDRLKANGFHRTRLAAPKLQRSR